MFFLLCSMLCFVRVNVEMNCCISVKYVNVDKCYVINSILCVIIMVGVISYLFNLFLINYN